jgi:hypothetical protein
VKSIENHGFVSDWESGVEAPDVVHYTDVTFLGVALCIAWI